MDFRDRIHKMMAEIKKGRANLYINGKQHLSALLPEEARLRGRIGLFKYWERPDVTYSNLYIRAAN